MKAKLIFNLPKERDTYELYMAAPMMDSAIWEFDSFLMDAYKYNIELSTDDVRNQWNETFCEYLVK